MGTDKEKLNIYFQAIGRANRQHYPQAEVIEVLPMEERIKELLQEQLRLSDYHKNAVERYEESYGDKESEYLDHHKGMYNYYQGGIAVLKRLLP